MGILKSWFKKRELNSRPKVIAIIKEFFAPLRCHSGSRISKQMPLHGFDEALVPALVVTAWFTNNGHIDMFWSPRDAWTYMSRPLGVDKLVPKKTCSPAWRNIQHTNFLGLVWEFLYNAPSTLAPRPRLLNDPGTSSFLPPRKNSPDPKIGFEAVTCSRAFQFQALTTWNPPEQSWLVKRRISNALT
jgi:hypothetical protein